MLNFIQKFIEISFIISIIHLQLQRSQRDDIYFLQRRSAIGHIINHLCIEHRDCVQITVFHREEHTYSQIHLEFWLVGLTHILVHFPRWQQVQNSFIVFNVSFLWKKLINFYKIWNFQILKQNYLSHHFSHKFHTDNNTEVFEHSDPIF